MTTELSTALTLLIIGMITVFVVLLLVVLTGNALISIVNRLSPAAPITSQKDEEASKVAAITAAVEVFTQGKGHITKIDKIR